MYCITERGILTIVLEPFTYANTCLQMADVATVCLDNHHQGLSYFMSFTSWVVIKISVFWVVVCKFYILVLKVYYHNIL